MDRYFWHCVLMYRSWPMLIYSNLNQCLIVIRNLWYQHIKIFTFGASVPIITNAGGQHMPQTITSQVSPQVNIFFSISTFSSGPTSRHRHVKSNLLTLLTILDSNLSHSTKDRNLPFNLKLLDCHTQFSVSANENAALLETDQWEARSGVCSVPP